MIQIAKKEKLSMARKTQFQHCFGGKSAEGSQLREVSLSWVCYDNKNKQSQEGAALPNFSVSPIFPALFFAQITALLKPKHIRVNASICTSSE